MSNPNPPHPDHPHPHPHPLRPAAPDSLWAALLDLVAAKECGGCGEKPLRKSSLCGRCTQALAAGPVRRAALQVPRAPRIFAATLYDDPVRTMLILYKERARVDLAWPLAAALARAVADGPGFAPPVRTEGRGTRSGSPAPAEARSLGGAVPALLLVPMPSTRGAVRRRGADTTAQLARAAARSLRAAGAGPVRAAPALRHVRRVADQAGLDRAERAANLAGALGVAGRWRRRLDGVPVVLVDDIVTSGATLAEGSRALRDAGAVVVGGAAVAAARVVR